jgi:cytidylate kinase
LLLIRKEKEIQVLKLAEECKTTRDMAKAVHISLKDIRKIIEKKPEIQRVLLKEKKWKRRRLRNNSG